MRVLNILRWALVGLIVLTLAAPALAVSVGGRLLVQVDGGSMKPTYQIGDVLLVREPTSDDLKVGNVVTAIDGNGDYYTHRIETVNPDGSVLLHGDGNAAADPNTVTLQQLRGVVELHFPQPWAFLIMQLQTWPIRICLLAVILGLSLIPLARRGVAGAETDAAPSQPVVASPASAVEASSSPVPARSARRRAESAPRVPRRKRTRAHAASSAAARRGNRAAATSEQATPRMFRSSWKMPVETTITEPDRIEVAVQPTAAEPVSVEVTTAEAASPVTVARTEPVAPVATVDAAAWGPRPATDGGVATPTVDAQTLEIEHDDADVVDAVDDVSNVVPASTVGAPTTGYSISVVDGPDGVSRVRISVDLDSNALAAALAVAGPSTVAGTPRLAPVVELVTARSAALQHVTSGATPPLAYAEGHSLRPRDGRRRHGRRRAS